MISNWWRKQRLWFGKKICRNLLYLLRDNLTCSHMDKSEALMIYDDKWVCCWCIDELAGDAVGGDDIGGGADGWCCKCKPVIVLCKFMLSEFNWCIGCEWCKLWICEWWWPRPGSNFGLISKPLNPFIKFIPAPAAMLWCWSDKFPPSIPLPFVDTAADGSSRFFVCFRCLARRFWNQIFTWRSDNCSDCASSDFRRIVMYCDMWYSFSNSKRW